jgi:Transposase DDE domain
MSNSAGRNAILPHDADLERRRESSDAYAGLAPQLLTQTVARCILEVTDLSAHSVRIEAHASMKEVRTLERSERRLEELGCVDTTALSEEQRLSHDARVAKHEAGVKRCNDEGLTNLVLTSPTTFCRQPRPCRRPCAGTAAAPAVKAWISKELKFFGRDRFVVHPDMSAVCPEGTRMEGPHKDEAGITSWYGVGCADCPMLAVCTVAKRRKLTVRTEYERGKTKMAARMTLEGARKRHNRRIGTVERAFSGLEDVMRFRRVSSRTADRAQALSLVVKEAVDAVCIRLDVAEPGQRKAGA